MIRNTFFFTNLKSSFTSNRTLCQFWCSGYVGRSPERLPEHHAVHCNGQTPSLNQIQSVGSSVGRSYEDGQCSSCQFLHGLFPDVHGVHSHRISHIWKTHQKLFNVHIVIWKPDWDAADEGNSWKFLVYVWWMSKIMPNCCSSVLFEMLCQKMFSFNQNVK